MTGARRPLAGAVLVLAAAALWGSFGIFARALYAHGYSALELTSVRMWVGWLGLGVAALLRPALRRSLRLPPRELAFFALYGTIGFAAFAFLFFATVERTTVAVAAALLYTAPAFVVVLARLLWREPLDAAKLAALAGVLAGVLLVTGALRALLTAELTIPAAAALLGLGSGFCYALYTLFSKSASRRFDAFTTLFYVFGAAALLFLVIAPPWPALARAPASWPLVLALGLVPSLLAFFLYLRGLRWLTASTAAMLASVEPVMAALLALLVLGEPLDAERLAGIALIVAAAVLLIRRAERVA